MSSVLKSQCTKHFSNENEDLKVSIVEHFANTLKDKIHRMITRRISDIYLDQLVSIVWQYFEIIHRSNGFKLISLEHENAHKVWFCLNKSHAEFNPPPKKQQLKLKIGDHVRLARGKWSVALVSMSHWAIINKLVSTYFDIRLIFFPLTPEYCPKDWRCINPKPQTPKPTLQTDRPHDVMRVSHSLVSPLSLF